MSRKKWAYLISTVCMLVLVGLICMASIRGGFGMGTFSFSGIVFGGKAELRNTIELLPEEVRTLEIEYGSKNIYVYPSTEDKIVIKEYLVSDSPAGFATVEKQEDKKVVVNGGNTLTVGIFVPLGEKIEIYLPESEIKTLAIQTGSGNVKSEFNYSNEEGSLSVQAGSGNIKWSNTVAAEAVFCANSGNVKLSRVACDTVEVQTGSGNIQTEELSGEVTVQTGSGNVTMEEFSGSGSVKASSGNVKVEGNKITGDIEMKTGSGNSILTLPKELSFQIEVKTGSGNIHTDFDSSLSFNEKRNRAEGTVGEAPLCRIMLEAGSGNVGVLEGNYLQGHAGSWKRASAL